MALFVWPHSARSRGLRRGRSGEKRQPVSSNARGSSYSPAGWSYPEAQGSTESSAVAIGNPRKRGDLLLLHSLWGRGVFW